MSPPAAKRDELVTVLLERLDRFEATLSGMRETLVRMEAGEEQARTMANEARLRVDDHEQRIAALEAIKHRAEGAANTIRVLWVAGGALVTIVAGSLGALAHYLLR
jgi:CHASE3 domain sensor protein